MTSRSAVLAASVTCKGFLHKHAAVEATFVTGSAPSLRAAALRPASLWSLGRGRPAVVPARLGDGAREAITGEGACTVVGAGYATGSPIVPLRSRSIEAHDR